MRELGYAVVDRLAAHLADPRSGPLVQPWTRDELESRLDRPPPEEGSRDLGPLLDRFWSDVVETSSRTDHPGYFAFIPSSPTYLGALGDFLASGVDLYAGSWMDGAGPTQLELTVLEWFRGWLGMPRDAGGILVSGGSAANMTAIACAREILVGPMSDRLVAYIGDQAHSSLARAARALGFRADQVRVLPSDAGLRMVPKALAEAIAIDRERGLVPMFVAAAGGATNTGVVDPLEAIAQVCRDAGVWFHVDAAYGAPAVLTERGRAELAGIELADSVTFDPHKWLYQPFECAALLVRDEAFLPRAFQIAPDYLSDTEVHGREVNLADHGLQLTRMARAVKVWLTIEYFGLDAIRTAIDRCLDLATEAEQRIRDDDRLELLHPRALSIVCFRRRVEGGESEAERVNAALVRSLERSGEALVSSTRLGGRFAVRLCVLGHGSTWNDVALVLDHFASAPVPVDPPAELARPAQRSSWLASGTSDLEDVQALPLFATFDDDDLRRLLDASHEARVPAGTAIIRRADAGRDFFVLLDGTAEVSNEGKVLRTLEAGDFFGELAARDWGAGYGYARLATVTATEDVRVLVVPTLAFNQAMRDHAAFAASVRAEMIERLDSVRPEDT
jgi:glutamate/tyrosine decarboxylase-like PLP-dependent enzyme